MRNKYDYNINALPAEIFEAIPDSAVYRYKAEELLESIENGERVAMLPGYYDIERKLVCAEAFVKQVIHSNEDLFIVKSYPSLKGQRKAMDTTLLGKRGQCIKSLPSLEELTEAFPNTHLSPRIMLLLTEIEKLSISKELYDRPNWIDNDKIIADCFNELGANIRRIGRSAAFQRVLNGRYNYCKRNADSVYDFVHTLFKKHARLLVVRIDFGYGEKHTQAITVDETKAHLANLLNNRRHNRIFEHLLGYIWKLEYRLKKGFHLHCFFFFDGSKRQQDINICHLIGEYWTSLTKGKGVYYNCNYSKHGYRYLGIGMINHDDTDKRRNLLIALNYVVKVDLFFKLKLTDSNGKSIRAFGRSTIKSTSNIPKGRPRKSVAQYTHNAQILTHMPPLSANRVQPIPVSGQIGGAA